MSHRVSPESLEAHAYGDKERLRTLALAYIRSCGGRGATADEACAALGMVHNSIAPRLSELRSSKVVIELYDNNGKRVRRKTRQGCAAGVLVAAEFAPTNHASHFQSAPIKQAQETMTLFPTETPRCWVDPEEGGLR